jgi:hypothetical protein
MCTTPKQPEKEKGFAKSQNHREDAIHADGLKVRASMSTLHATGA